MGRGEDTSLAGRRKETLDSILDLAFSFSLGPSSSEALPLPLAVPCESRPDWSAGGAGSFALDFVAVRKLCSNEDRRRLNVFGWWPAAADAAGCCSRDEDAAGAPASRCFWDGIACVLETVTLSLATAAAMRAGPS